MGCSSPSSSSALIVIFSLFWLVFGGEVRSDRSVLLQVKRFLLDPSGQLDSWNEDIHFCRWFGITCNSNSRVTGLRIPAINGTVYVAGRLTPAISELTELRCLSLPFNRLTGEIPDQLWEMENIEVLRLEGNLLAGTLPLSFRGLRRLRVLNLGSNEIHGEVPPSVSNCSSLQILNMSFNRISGRLPREIGYSCRELAHVDLSGNFLVGAIPAGFGNCTRLRSLLLRSNLLGDVIPASLGFLRSLEILDVSKNSLSGSIPPQIGNCTRLSVLVLSNIRRRNFSQDDYNYFEGNIPPEIWSLPSLRLLWCPRASLEGTLPANVTGCGSLEIVNLGQNFFSGEIPAWLSHCPRLRFLDLSLNLLTGKLRSDIRVPCMRFFDVSGNRLHGNIPRFDSTRCVFPSSSPSELYVSFFSGLPYESRLSGGVLVIHRFSRNHFRGVIDSLPISPDLRRKKTTYVFGAGRNAIGEFPVNLFADCDGLDALFVGLSRNRITGEIPARIGCGSLRALDLSGNRISGSIEESVSSLFFLVSLNISWNDLRGRIPESVGEMKRLRFLSLAGNQLTGSIPPALGEMRSLEVLELSSNALSGEIPNAMLNLSNLTALLLDNNKLTGQIPNFAQVKTLSTFNASFNNLSGPLPANGDIVKCNSLVGNPLLHGSCHSSSSAAPVIYETPANSADLTVSPPGGGRDGGGLSSVEIASIASSSAVFLVLVTLIGVLLYARKCKPRFNHPRRPARKEVTVFTDIGVPLTFENVVQATASFSASNCIGNGGFGATYKAEISPGVLIAVKRLAIGRFQGAQQFHAEIKTLGRLRHRNLVTLIGYHASETEMFLVYNYLPGGNLEKFIQERSVSTIDWRILQKIALNIACALAYLHDQCVPRVVHRDVKPSNILLDDDHDAYLSDFGLARLLGTSETHATTGVAGTFGYVAPEYAMTCRVSDKADVYSYGVVLLELLSDKKALDPSFSSYGNGFNIVGWASMLVQEERAGEFFTAGLWEAGAHDQLVEMLQLAVTCTLDSLPARPPMRHVVRRLKNLHPPPPHMTS